MLGVVVLPLVAVTLYRTVRDQLREHRRVMPLSAVLPSGGIC